MPSPALIRLFLELLGLPELSSPNFPGGLTDSIHQRLYQGYVRHIKDDMMIMLLVDPLDEAIDRLGPSDGPTINVLSYELGSICEGRTVLPTSYKALDQRPTGPQGPRRGTPDAPPTHYNYKHVEMGMKMFGQRARLQWIKGAFCKEAVKLKHLKHDNIVDAMDLYDYIRRNPKANPLGPLVEVVEGLCYLHSQDVVHGALKPGNIVVWPNGKTFGPAAVLPLPRCRNTADPDGGNTWPWTAPELLQEGVWCSEKSDVFAFAMVMLEVFGIHEAKRRWPSITEAMQAIRDDRQPRKPKRSAFGNDLWKLMRQCWSKDPLARPVTLRVRRDLGDLSGFPISGDTWADYWISPRVAEGRETSK